MTKHIDPDDAITTLQQMFAEHRLEEYEESFTALLDGYYKLCELNRERLHTEVRIDDRGAA